MSCPECPHCRATAEEARCESPVEVLFLREIRKERLFDAFAPNVEVMTGRYRIDFADIHTLIGIEIDGHKFHSDKKAFVNDRHRQRVLEQAGWRLIRFAAVEVMDDAANCVRQFGDWLHAVRTIGVDLNPLVLDDRRAPAPIDITTGRVRLGGRVVRDIS